ncbi:chromate efflux transporter [Paenibacillus sp. H1-7]|uniref:chromate efflux transporter n=1 Tax=Paenibacillus sp. H1-7 TaxID=2282849 RepID=UPI001EF803D6|nr:chromate efflux transporter [Paenibacillus sp. H1-7]
MNRWRAWLEIGKVSLRLGLTSFGGPVAHLGYFRDEYVQRKRWMDEQSYADLVALCQFLPGPASSQVGIGIGYYRGGMLGGLIAWLGFTLPSALALALFAALYQAVDPGASGWIHGLKLAAVAIVAQAVWGMGKSFVTDRWKAAVAVLSAVILLMWSSAAAQLSVIVASAIAGWLLYRHTGGQESGPKQTIQGEGRVPGMKLAVSALLAFALLLIGLPLLNAGTGSQLIAIADSFYRSGSLVFGGGHVVLPLLEKEVVPSGWMSREQFLAGYGATQAVPGPLFTFAAYLGMVIGGWPGAVMATLAIFLPAFLLVIGVLPFWERLRSQPAVRAALTGVHAAVVGILLAALYDPVWTSAVESPADFGLALVLFGGLVFWKLPPWLVVAAAALGGLFLPLL